MTLKGIFAEPSFNTAWRAMERELERGDYIESESEYRANCWKAELDETGIILDLGWEWGDVKIATKEHNQGNHSNLTPMDYLHHVAYEQVKEEAP